MPPLTRYLILRAVSDRRQAAPGSCHIAFIRSACTAGMRHAEIGKRMHGVTQSGY